MTPAVARVLEEVSEETRALAAKAAEEGVHAARRGYRLARRGAEDVADAAATRVRKQPLTFVGAALGAGLVIGAAGGFLVAVLASRWVAVND